MTGSTIGKLFKVTTFGESHGKAVGVIIDGCPAGINISETDIQSELDRRRPGQSKVSTPRNESDTGHILSGVFKGKTTGHPICIIINNNDADSSKYENIKDVFRPGHADFTYHMKYGIRDYRGSGRASGRETAARVAAGAIAKKVLEKLSMTKVIAYTSQIGKFKAKKIDFEEIEKNIVRCPDKAVAKDMIKLVETVQKEGDSIGGQVDIIVQHPPIGLGDPCFDKLQADLGKSLFSIGAIKGVEFGAGFGVARMKGSKCNDTFVLKGDFIRTKTNNAGGILGGISTGEDIVIRIAVKPPSSILKEQDTVTANKAPAKIKVEGRHDPTICPRVVPVAESMVAITLLDKLLINKAYQEG